MRLIIAGGRDLDSPEAESMMIRILSGAIFRGTVTEVVSGACRLKRGQKGFASGADGLGERWAKRVGIPRKRFYAEDYGEWPECGPKRNRAMAEYANCLLALPGGRGTDNMIREMKRLGKPYIHIAGW